MNKAFKGLCQTVFLGLCIVNTSIAAPSQKATNDAAKSNQDTQNNPPLSKQLSKQLGNQLSNPLSAEQLAVELKKVPRLALLKGRFKQNKKISEFDLNLSTEGEFEIHQPQAPSSQNPKSQTEVATNPFKLLWKVVKPELTDICIDKTNVVITTTDLKGIKQTRKIPVNELASSSQSLPLLFKLFQLDPHDLTQSFLVSKVTSDDFILIPRPETGVSISQIKLHFNKKGLIENTEIIEKNNDTLNINFFDLKESDNKDPKLASGTSC